MNSVPAVCVSNSPTPKMADLWYLLLRNPSRMHSLKLSMALLRVCFYVHFKLCLSGELLSHLCIIVLIRL